MVQKTRECPECGKEIRYKTKRNYADAARKNTMCKSCCHIGSRNGNYGNFKSKKRTCPTCDKKLKYKNRRARQDAERGGRLCKSCSKTNPSKETRRKRRLSMLARIEKLHGRVYPNYNPEACKIIDEYGAKHGYNFQHAENGGEYFVEELGYFVDGYDKEKNAVVEVYEPWHSWREKRDSRRKEEIINQLKCEFAEIYL